MSQKWDSGNPRDSPDVAGDPWIAFDDHNYIGFALSSGSQDDLMRSACTDQRHVDGEDIAITGEWSLTSDVDWSDTDFFRRWFTAQQQLYEKDGMGGWVYWTWKTESTVLWSYELALKAGIMPKKAYKRDFNCDSTVPDFGGK